MQVTETYGTSSSLDTLICELEQLSHQYKSFLEQESLIGDVQCLHNWISSYKNGRVEAGEYIHEYGYDLLSNIKRRLKNAESDIQRMDGESPNSQYFSGGRAHKISRAIALTSEMQGIIKQVTSNEVVA